jgi:hypothetical protein
LYHSHGPSKEKPVNPASEHFKRLGMNGMRRYKLIFDNNNRELVNEFFTDPFIQRLWPTVLENLTLKLCFGAAKPNQEIETTFREITRIMDEQYGLSLPKWWVKKFPPNK